jgi:spermidine synthase
MSALGRHLLVELYGCPSGLLDDARHLEDSLRQAAHQAGARVLEAVFHCFSPHGVTGVLLIQESHLAIHTWPEHGFAAADLFTCGKQLDPWSAYGVLKERLQAARSTAMELGRGRPETMEELQREMSKERE